MIVCPTCRHNNPETARACENCGRSLEGFIYRTCPACGALNPAQSAFCRRCLNELLPVGEEPTSEKILRTKLWASWGRSGQRYSAQRQPRLAADATEGSASDRLERE